MTQRKAKLTRAEHARTVKRIHDNWKLVQAAELEIDQECHALRTLTEFQTQSFRELVATRLPFSVSEAYRRAAAHEVGLITRHLFQVSPKSNRSTRALSLCSRSADDLQRVRDHLRDVQGVDIDTATEVQIRRAISELGLGHTRATRESTSDSLPSEDFD